MLATNIVVYSILFCCCLCYSLASASSEFPLRAQKLGLGVYCMKEDILKDF